MIWIFVENLQRGMFLPVLNTKREQKGIITSHLTTMETKRNRNTKKIYSNTTFKKLN